MKKLFFYIALFFIGCSFFHTQILGIAVRLALKFQYDCELAYRSVKWEEGELVFSDLVLFDPSFHTHIQKASIQFDWREFPEKLKGHLQIDNPYLSISKLRSFSSEGEGWFDFSASINNGILDWEGPVRFSAEHRSEKSQLGLEWSDATAFLTFEEGKLEGELEHFKIPLLKQWVSFGDLSEGRVTGRFSIDTEGELLSANLKIGATALSFPLGAVDGLEGTFSYNADIGGKCDLQGIGKAQGKQFPFTYQGRGFFKSGWIESKIQFDDSWCQLTKGGTWSFECNRLHSEQATWFQGAVSALIPEVLDWSFVTGTLNGKGDWSRSAWNAQFDAEDLTLIKKGYDPFICKVAKADVTQNGGDFTLSSPEFDIHFNGLWKGWNATARIGEIDLNLKGGWDGEKVPIHIEKGIFSDLAFSGDGWVDQNLDLSFTLDGEWSILQRKIPFHSPNVSKQGKFWTFDFRGVRKMWDLFRLAGTYDGAEITYHKRSHLLGAPLHFKEAPLGEFDVALELPWEAILSAGPFLKEWGFDLRNLPTLEKTALHFQLRGGEISFTGEGATPPFAFSALQKGGEWELNLQSDLILQAVLKNDGKVKGKGSWKTEVQAEFDGKISPSFHCEFSLPKLAADLKIIEALKMEGTVEGQGHFVYNGEIESDFDLKTSSLIINSHPLENGGEVQLSYSSSTGFLLRGINLHGPFDCSVDLLKYDKGSSHWIFQNAQVHLPGPFLNHRFLEFLDKKLDLNFTANLDFAADFSTFVCTMREGLIPYDGAYHHIENLDLSWSQDRCKAALHYQGHYHRLQFQMDDHITGRLTLGEEEEPLSIDWEYNDKLLIHSIEGSFQGVNAAFHAESPNQLVGNAHVNFTTFATLLPPDVAQVFDEIKMGKGYELKGRLRLEKNRPFFQGLLSGKGVELFGFQFRTLLAQVDLGPESMRIYDVKISDSAGMMKIDEVLFEGKDDKPWTISIPNLVIREMRPCLLLRPGGTVGPIDPLVVRELKVSDFKGLLDDGKTYTAKGELHFINSYKREETVFDLPANVLSRIVGLDLELLIPVTGDLVFELKEGYFNLLELKNAYSEAKRSEFFLEMNPPPRMDLDGNLQIFIKMKQFVLLKITESLLISIDGALDDPQFHLTKKRFFGLM